MDPLPPLESPRLRRLQRALARDRRRTLAAFWTELAARGTPLVEELPPALRARYGGSQGRLLTFLWRGAPATRRVDLLGSFGFQFPEPMTQLHGTEVWYRSLPVAPGFRGTYRFVVDPSAPPHSYRGWVAQLHSSRLDPWNPRRFRDPKDPGDPGGPHGVPASEIALPSAPEHPWLGPRDVGAAPIVLHLFRRRSRALRSDRRVWAYLPSILRRGPQAGRAVRNLAIFFDGFDYAFVLGAPPSLEALHARGEIEPTAALFVGHPPRNGRAADLLWSTPFERFLSRELLPWARRDLGLRVPASRTVLVGASYGGLAAVAYALNAPEDFGAAISQSGSFSARPKGDPEPEWTSRHVVHVPRRQVRVRLSVGTRETFVLEPGTQFPTLLASNRHLRDVLRAKGYEVSYSEFNGGHDDGCWRQALPEDLRAILGKPARAPRAGPSPRHP